MTKPSSLVGPLALLVVAGPLIGIAVATDVLPLWGAAIVVVVIAIIFALLAARGRFVRRS